MSNLLQEAPPKHSPPRGGRWTRVLWLSISSWLSHRPASKGAALAFYTLFSISPILVIAVAVSGQVFGAQAARDEIFTQLQGIVGRAGAQTIRDLLVMPADSVSGWYATGIAGLVLLFGATSVFAELKDSLDDIWGRTTGNRSAILALLKTRLLSFLLLFVLAFLVLGSLIASEALGYLAQHAAGYWGDASGLFALLAAGLSFAVATMLFAIIFKTLPNAPLSWRDACVGAVFTMGLFALGKAVIGIYLSATDVTSGFGAAGSLVALLLWLYYSAQMFFLGAEFTRQYALHCGSLRGINETIPMVGKSPSSAA